jgi:hypothetical protein
MRYILDAISQIPQFGSLQHVLSCCPHPLAPFSGSGFFLAYPAAFIQYVLVYCYNQSLILEPRKSDLHPSYMDAFFT